MINLQRHQAHLGVPIWDIYAPFCANALLGYSYKGLSLAKYAVHYPDSGESFYEDENISFWFSGSVVKNEENDCADDYSDSQCILRIKAQERLDIGNACIYLSNEIFGENLEGIDSLSISFQPNKNEAVFYERLLLTPEAAQRKLSVNYNSFSAHSVDACYLEDILTPCIIRDCLRESVQIYIEQVLKPEKPNYVNLERFFKKTNRLP
jgi:hypothetical protein